MAGMDNGSNWQAVGTLDDIEDARGKRVVINGAEIAVMRDGSDAFALGATCPHRGGPIADGKVVNGEVICPLHSWNFHLGTGISPFNPNDTLPSFPCRVTGEGVIEIDASRVPAEPGRPKAYLSQWWRRGATDHGMYLVHHLAEGGGATVEAMGSERARSSTNRATWPGLDELVFKPAQLARLPLLDHEEVTTTVTLGPECGRPLQLEMPVYVSHMSFGALSAEAKEALARGAAAAGTAICSGEGGALPVERDNAGGRYIFEMASGYFGWTEEAMRKADAIEIKIGQGAKPGLGGLLPGAKVTAEIAAVRGIEFGADAHSPAHFPDVHSLDDLRRKVVEIRGITGGVPIGVKFAAGHVEEDMEAAAGLGVDFVTVDGFGGGTGAAPVHIKDHVSIPSMFGVARARDWLDANDSSMQLVATGGYRTPDEIAKILAVGADAVALATSALMAIGCQQYRACHKGTCPVGIATQLPELRSRLDIETSATRLASFLRATTAMLVDYARACGRSSVSDLDRSDLACLDPDLASRLHVEYVL